MKKLSIAETLSLCMPYLQAQGIGQDQDETWFESLITVFKDRLVYGQQIVNLYHEFFNQTFKIEDEALTFIKQEGVKALLETFKQKLSDLTDIQPDDLKRLIKESGKETGMKGKMLFMPIRIAVSGTMHGPDLPQMMNLMGKTRLNERLEKAIGLI